MNECMEIPKIYRKFMCFVFIFDGVTLLKRLKINEND